MSKVLVKFRDNWADEMDVYGSRVMTKEDWEKYIHIATECFQDYYNHIENENQNDDSDVENYWDEYGSIEFCIGSNESIEYMSVAAFKSCFTVVEITDNEAEVLMKCGLDNFGFFPEEVFEEWMSWNNIEF